MRNLLKKRVEYKGEKGRVVSQWENLVTIYFNKGGGVQGVDYREVTVLQWQDEECLQQDKK